MIKDLIIYFLAAFFEIFGCYSFWIVIKQQKPSYWLAIGIVSLILFAFALTKINLEFAGRTYAIYGGIYIISSLFWLYFVEKQLFNRWDIIGAIVVFIGIGIILLGNQKELF